MEEERAGRVGKRESGAFRGFKGGNYRWRTEWRERAEEKRKKREEDIKGEARRGERVKRRAVCMRNYSLGHDDTMHQSALLT